MAILENRHSSAPFSSKATSCGSFENVGLQTSEKVSWEKIKKETCAKQASKVVQSTTWSLLTFCAFSLPAWPGSIRGDSIRARVAVTQLKMPDVQWPPARCIGPILKFLLSVGPGIRRLGGGGCDRPHRPHRFAPVI